MMLSFILSVTDAEYRDPIERLYRTFHKDALRFAASRFAEAGKKDAKHLAEDAVQNVFYQLAKNAQLLPQNDNKVQKVYLFTCIVNEVNLVLNNMKCIEQCQETQAPITDADFIDRICIRERYEQVVKAIERLDDRYSTVLLWRYAGEVSVKKISHILGIKEKTVYTRLERAKKLLLDELGEKE